MQVSHWNANSEVRFGDNMKRFYQSLLYSLRKERRNHSVRVTVNIHWLLWNSIFHLLAVHLPFWHWNANSEVSFGENLKRFCQYLQHFWRWYRRHHSIRVTVNIHWLLRNPIFCPPAVHVQVWDWIASNYEFRFGDDMNRFIQSLLYLHRRLRWNHSICVAVNIHLVLFNSIFCLPAVHLPFWNWIENTEVRFGNDMERFCQSLLYLHRKRCRPHAMRVNLNIHWVLWDSIFCLPAVHLPFWHWNANSEVSFRDDMRRFCQSLLYSHRR
jgi:hypothetical protein